jgi:hypothetical protein
MINMIRMSATVAAGSIALMTAAPAMSDTLYASSGYVNNNGAEVGDYAFDNTSSSLIAATFTLAQQSHVTGVGGVFTQFGDGGSIFASLIAAPAAQTSVTAGSLPGLSLANAVFTPPEDGSDATTPLSVTLSPGTYELVFGSGLFGATGYSGLASGMNGQASLLQTVDGGASWDALNDSVRVTVSGNVVPLPAALPLLCSGLAAGFGLMRRRRGARSVADQVAA